MHTLSNGVLFISRGNKWKDSQIGVNEDAPRFSESSWVRPQCLSSRVKREDLVVGDWLARHQAPPTSCDIAALGDWCRKISVF